MRAVLDFNIDEVKRIVAHAKAAPKHMAWYGEEQGAAVLLVKDEGIYLMSNGLPFDPAEPGDARDVRRFVAYAKGFGPKAGYDKIRAAVGGDDFSEPIPAADFETAIKAGDRHLRIVLTENQLSIQTAR